MAFHHYNLIWELPLQANSKIVLLAIARYADKAGTCWPSMQTLADCTGLCVRTIKTLVPKLKQQGYISISRNKEGQRYYLTLPVASVTLDESAGFAPLEVQHLHLERAGFAPKHTNEQIKEQIIEPAFHARTQEYISIGVIDMGKYPEGMKATDVLGVLGSKTKTRKNNVQGLEGVWKDNLPLLFDEQIVRPWTAKERGIAGHFLTRMQGHDACKVFEHVLQNWADFTSQMREDHGLEDVPKKPNVPWITKFATEALNYMLQEPKKAQVTLIAPVAKVAPPSMSQSAIKGKGCVTLEKGEHTTLEDLAEIEKQFGIGG